GKHTWLSLTLKEGRNREVKRLAEALGYEVLRLRRYSFAHLSIEGLPPGGYRFLDLDEVERLRALCQQAGAEVEEPPVAAAPPGVSPSGLLVQTRGHRGALAFDVTPQGTHPTPQDRRGTTRVAGFDEEGNPLPRSRPRGAPEERARSPHGTRVWTSD